MMRIRGGHSNTSQLRASFVVAVLVGTDVKADRAVQGVFTVVDETMGAGA